MCTSIHLECAPTITKNIFPRNGPGNDIRHQEISQLNLRQTSLSSQTTSLCYFFLARKRAYLRLPLQEFNTGHCRSPPTDTLFVTNRGSTYAMLTPGQSSRRFFKRSQGSRPKLAVKIHDPGRGRKNRVYGSYTPL